MQIRVSQLQLSKAIFCVVWVCVEGCTGLMLYLHRRHRFECGACVADRIRPNSCVQFVVHLAVLRGLELREPHLP